MRTWPDCCGRIDGVLHQVPENALETLLVAERRAPRRRWRAPRCPRARLSWLPPRARPPWQAGSGANALRRGCRSKAAASSLFMRSSTCLTVANMSSWKRGLWRCRSAFLRSSESCATRFLRSCTTNAVILLNDSNLRASSSASEACTWARKLPTCRAAVLSRSRTSQLNSILARGVASTANPVSSSSAITGTTSQAAGSSAATTAAPELPVGCECLQVDHPAGLRKKGGEGAVRRVHALRARACSSAPPARSRCPPTAARSRRPGSRPGWRAPGSSAAPSSSPGSRLDSRLVKRSHSWR